MEPHDYYMSRAFELAKFGWGRTNPNPLVGVVIVKNGEIIAEGCHEVVGCAHAEVAAFNNAKQSVEGSTLYVNLEPCSHYGRTPPCANAIIEAGVKKVVVAMVDPNPKVSGKGIQMLKDSGIDVTMGVLEEEAKKLNEIFIKYITQKKPFVIMKTAMTLDGKIASCSGDSKWISGESSREYVHVLRDRVSAIMVGVGTVLKDNPYLTARLLSKECKDPVRIIIDSKGKTPLDSNVFNSSASSGVIIGATSQLDYDKERLFKEKGACIIRADGNAGHVDLDKLMDELYKLEIDSILLEGGGNLNAAALDAGIVDKVLMFISPKIIGGKESMTPVEGLGRQLMKDAVQLKNITINRFDEDVLIEGYINS